MPRYADAGIARVLAGLVKPEGERVTQPKRNPPEADGLRHTPMSPHPKGRKTSME